MKVWLVLVMLSGVFLVTAKAEISIVPKPAEIKVGAGEFKLAPRMVIAVDPAFQEGRLGTTVVDYLAPATGVSFKLARTGGDIQLKKISPTAKLGTEGYRLSVTSGKILIESPTAAGAFYGIQTLRQLLPPQIFASSKQSGVSWTVPCLKIVDYPRFPWRGLHIDVSRHFRDADYIKRFIDLLALHKMNTLHWHLVDDDGWRIEIKKYPKLALEGSSRSRRIKYKKPMFYTQEEIREVVRYAATRHVNIVPEIEIPGHEGAAIRVYPEFGARNAEGKLGNVFNIQDETVAALKEILDEVVELFPGPYIHCGGDEVRQAWVWEVDPKSKAKAQKLGLDGAHEIQTWLMNEMASHLESKGRRMVGWDEIFGDNLGKDSVVMGWRGDGEVGTRAAKKGFDVVMAPGRYTYFDHRQAPDEEGFGVAVITPERVYSFNPADPHALSSSDARHILGVQGQLWAERILTEERMDYMAYPRGCALAEVGWTPQDKRSFDDFNERLGMHFQRLDELKVNYRMPSGLEIEEQAGEIIIRSSRKEGAIHYTLDDSDPTATSPRYTRPIPLEKVSILKARFITATGRSGAITRYVGFTTFPLLAETCIIEGGMSVETLKSGQTCVGGWGDAKGTLTWKVKIEKAGSYMLDGLFSTTKTAHMKLAIGKRSVSFAIDDPKGWREPVSVQMGKIKIPAPGIYTVILSVAKPQGYKGVNMWRIDLSP